MATFDRRAIPERAVESRWLARDGYPIRRIDWPMPDAQHPRGSILFLPGRGDNYEKYLETLDHWSRKGWKVTASDWRGQAGSGRLGLDKVTGHIDDFGTWIADLAHLWRQWTAETPGPHILAGHSMGGHLVLRAVADGAVTPDALILSAPMLGFRQILPDVIMHAAARLMASLGDRLRPAWKWSEKPGELPANRVNLLTHDPDRYEDEIWWREHRPELVMGPGSWGWVERGFASVRGMNRPGVLEAVQTPVYVVATDSDRLVDFGSIKRAVKRLPHAEMLCFGEEAYHEVLREVDAVRDKALAGIDDFLDRTFPPQDM